MHNGCKPSKHRITQILISEAKTAYPSHKRTPTSNKHICARCFCFICICLTLDLLDLCIKLLELTLLLEFRHCLCCCRLLGRIGNELIDNTKPLADNVIKSKHDYLTPK